MVEMVVNPNYQKEMLRNQDRMLSHLETIPEGFNALRRMYSNLQEPMFKAMESANVLKIASELHSSLPRAGINNEPLPNPWVKKSVQSKSFSPLMESKDPSMSNMSSPFMFFPELSRNTSSASTSSNNRLGNLSMFAPSSSSSQMASLEQNIHGLNIESNMENFEIRYKSQLDELRSMGFTDNAANIRALLAAGGNLHSAIEYLLRGSS